MLKTLGAGPNHGYGIASRIRQLSDDVLRIEEGSLYPALLASAAILALAIGANVAIFAVVNRVVLNPLPYPDSDRLVLLDHSMPRINVCRASARPRVSTCNTASTGLACWVPAWRASRIDPAVALRSE